MEGCFYNY